MVIKENMSDSFLFFFELVFNWITSHILNLMNMIKFLNGVTRIEISLYNNRWIMVRIIRENQVKMRNSHSTRVLMRCLLAKRVINNGMSTRRIKRIRMKSRLLVLRKSSKICSLWRISIRNRDPSKSSRDNSWVSLTMNKHMTLMLIIFPRRRRVLIYSILSLLRIIQIIKRFGGFFDLNLNFV